MERVAYEFTIDDRTLAVVFDDCRQAEAFGDVCVVNRTDPEGRVSLHESNKNIMHQFALDDCRTIAADVAGLFASAAWIAHVVSASPRKQVLSPSGTVIAASGPNALAQPDFQNYSGVWLKSPQIIHGMFVVLMNAAREASFLQLVPSSREPLAPR